MSKGALWALGLIGVGGLGLVVWLIIGRPTEIPIVQLEKEEGSPVNMASGSGSETEASVQIHESEPSAENTRRFSTGTVLGIDQRLAFIADIPVDWGVEYVDDIQSLNFFNPEAPGETNLEKSQIFVRYFRATDFLTLSTVTIHSREELTINGQPAVRYDIEKKAEVDDFPSQPSWRNGRHFVTDIRSSNDALSTFYVFAQRPGLSDEVFNAVLDSVQFILEDTEGFADINDFS